MESQIGKFEKVDADYIECSKTKNFHQKPDFRE